VADGDRGSIIVELQLESIESELGQSTIRWRGNGELERDLSRDDALGFEEYELRDNCRYIGQ